MRSSETFTEQARRAQIVTGAMRVIADGGYAEASVAKIADSIGVAKSVVLYHFKSKSAIIDAVVANVFGAAAGQMAAALTGAGSPADRLTAYIRTNIAFIDGDRVAATAMLEIVTNYRTPEGARIGAGTPPETSPFAVLDPFPIFADGVRTGQFRALSPLFMKNALRAALDGAVWEVARDPDYDIFGYGEELVLTFALATRRPS